MDIEFDLTRHCVETETRRLYHRYLSQCLARGTAGDLERAGRAVEVLREMLETVDFRALRAAFPVLSGGSDAQVSLSIAAGGPWEFRVDGRTVKTFPAGGGHENR